MLVLRRLSEAVQDGDDILAVIRGTAVNHGGTASGFTVPNGAAHQALIREAWEAAGVEAGDRVEVAVRPDAEGGEPELPEELVAALGRIAGGMEALLTRSPADRRQLVRWIEAQQPPLPERAVLVLLFGEPGLADARQAERFRYLAYGGGVLNAAHPEAARVLRLHDLSRRPLRNAIRPDSVYLALRDDLSFERADDALYSAKRAGRDCVRAARHEAEDAEER